MAIQPLPPIPVSVNPPNYSFGMVGLTAGQILRVVVTNVGTAPPIASPIAIPACGASVKLFDQDGKAVGASGQIGSLAAGKSFAVEQAGPTGSGRLEYRAQVQVVFPIVSAGTPVRLMVCSIISTVQVYDTVTGKTYREDGRRSGWQSVNHGILHRATWLHHTTTRTLGQSGELRSRGLHAPGVLSDMVERSELFHAFHYPHRRCPPSRSRLVRCQRRSDVGLLDGGAMAAGDRGAGDAEFPQARARGGRVFRTFDRTAG